LFFIRAGRRVRREDDLDAPLARDAEVTVVAALAGGWRLYYLTVVGMFLIFPLMI
jgi:hypothetical protein